MIQSLKSYAKCFSSGLKSAEKRKYLKEELKKKNELSMRVSTITVANKVRALKNAILWLEYAQNKMIDDGIGSYHLIDGWGTSYPETTGYIIPTWLNYSAKRIELKEKAFLAAKWLIEIQKESGGWQSMRIADKKPEVVFNTGQVMRGMLAAYKISQEKIYLDAAIKAGNWLASIQNEQGYWDKHVFMDIARVYDSYVASPLVELGEITGDDVYKKSALKNIDWIINTQQQENGWFKNCDNTVKHNDRPILHTIAYTIDGILDCGLTLKNEMYINSAIKPAYRLMKIFEANNYLHLSGRFDASWRGSEHLITTGCAQMAIIWFKIYQYNNEVNYLHAACKMNDLLVAIQSRHHTELNDTKGGLFGSFPLWGRYEKFAFPNWATKYLADALMLELALN